MGFFELIQGAKSPEPQSSPSELVSPNADRFINGCRREFEGVVVGRGLARRRLMRKLRHLSSNNN